MLAKVHSVMVDSDERVIINLISDGGKYYSEDGTDVIKSIYGYKRNPRKFARSVRKKIVSKAFRINAATNEIMDFDDTLRRAIIA